MTTEAGSRKTWLLLAAGLVGVAILVAAGITIGRSFGTRNDSRGLKLAFVDRIAYESIEDDGAEVRVAPLRASQKRRNARQLLVQTIDSVQLRRGVSVQLYGPEPKWETELARQHDLAAVITFGPAFLERVDSLTLSALVSNEGSARDWLTGLDIEVRPGPSFEGMQDILDDLVRSTVRRKVIAYVGCRVAGSTQVEPESRDRCEEWEKPWTEGDAWPEPESPQSSSRP